MNPQPRITFGIIVLNGEPFTRYCLRALYPFAHEIIVVEGACPAAAGVATPAGHSRDATLAVLRDFQAHEDPEHKVQIVTAEDTGQRDGFWRGEKDQQSQAYAARATGDYLWQVDIDEFYQAVDMRAVIALLAEDPSLTAVTFHQLQFWGGFDVTVDGYYLRRGGDQFHRLFKWGPGYRYVKHRPPTVFDHLGRDTRQLQWRTGRELAQRGIFLYHYCLVFPKQVQEKCDYYSKAALSTCQETHQWAREVYEHLARPYHAHNMYDQPGWLQRYHGRHPEQIVALQGDIAAGRLTIALRRTDDVARLLRSWRYRVGVAALQALDPFDRVWRRFWIQHPPEGKLRWLYPIGRRIRDAIQGLGNGAKGMKSRVGVRELRA